ncbi:hypothetical protein EB74_12670 [Mycobacterium sp. SWH-M5]|nr:hypothetical protein EB74_12670 [Mycobacterium sp. SWH-M5]
MDILLTQTATVVYRLRYSRETAAALLVESGMSAEQVAAMDKRGIGDALAQRANDTATHHVLYDRLVADAGDYEEIIANGDWEITEVYGSPGPTPVATLPVQT